jgi:FlaA1/EpsC-like NDP-sugar epimerase
MGASKRLAELVVQEAAARAESTVVAMVRFGNVLGSSGSVVPLFEEQISAGGPVTVTHSSITRYFMTVPEAASLVIQAGAMATGGEVFVLDMGEPVKVLDLAHKMIHLMGCSVRDENNPGGDIEIQFTGLRPGEKLYEELLIGDNAKGTGHPRIMCAQEDRLTGLELRSLLDQLRAAIQTSDFDAIRDILITAPLDYVPSSPITDNLVSADPAPRKVGEQDNVTFLDATRDG